MNPHLGPSGPTSNVPMAGCLALLRAFDKANPTPAQAVSASAAIVCKALGKKTLADVNDGELAALIDMALEQGEAAFKASEVCRLVKAGNHAKPPKLMRFSGPRGAARADVWNTGNSA